MLKIRLARVGKKKNPTYRFIVSEASKDPYGKALEILGHYNPFSKVIEVKKDRILEWISKGAQLSPTVHNILVDQNVIQKDKVKASKGKKKNAEAEKPAEAKAENTEAKPEDKPAEVSPEEPKEEVKSEAPAEEKK